MKRSALIGWDVIVFPITPILLLRIFFCFFDVCFFCVHKKRNFGDMQVFLTCFFTVGQIKW